MALYKIFQGAVALSTTYSAHDDQQQDYPEGIAGLCAEIWDLVEMLNEAQ